MLPISSKPFNPNFNSKYNSYKKEKILEFKIQSTKRNFFRRNRNLSQVNNDWSTNNSNFRIYNKLNISSDSTENERKRTNNSFQNNQSDQSYQQKYHILQNSNEYNRQMMDIQNLSQRNQLHNISTVWKAKLFPPPKYTSNSNKSDNEKQSQQNIRISPLSALKKYGSQMTDFEKEEIFGYPDIWFLGLNTQKIEAQLDLCSNNRYDDENGAYIKVARDHIAYRFEILETLGKGSFGQVFKAIDHKSGQSVAIKVIRNKKRFHEQSLVEIDILKYLQEKERKSGVSFHIINLIENFVFRNHPILVFELLGDNLYEVIRKSGFRGLSLSIIQRIAHATFTCLSVLQRENIIHCDLKPENIVVVNNDASQIKVIDFGSSCFGNKKIYSYIQSRFYRAPEIILGIPYTTQIDVWSLGCLLPELLTGRPIFPGESEMDQLLCIMEVCNFPPNSIMMESTRKSLFFDDRGEPRKTINNKGCKRVPNSQTIQSMMKTGTDSKFLDLIMHCLQWDSKLRITPENALKHPWLQDCHLNVESFRNSVLTERKRRCQRLKPKQLKKDNDYVLVHSNTNDTTQTKEFLPPIGEENKQKTECMEKENTPFTEFPSLYR